MFQLNKFIIVLLLNYVKGDVYTSLASVENLLETQRNVILAVERSLNETIQFLEYLNGYRDMLREEYELAIKDKDDYLGNTLNVFRLFRSLSYDLSTVKSKHDEIGRSFNKSLVSIESNYPDKNEINGVVSAFIRLRATYKLDIEDLAEGKIYNISYTKPLTSDDCIILANEHYDIGDYYYAIKWAEVALKKLKPGDELINIMHDFIAQSYEILNDKNNVLKSYDILIADDPDDPYPLLRKGNFLLDWKHKITNNEEFKNHTEDAMNFRLEKLYSQSGTASRRNFLIYEELCRTREIYPLPNVTKNLRCYYHRGQSSFLKLAPVKAEMLFIDPEIIRFYDVISEVEINQMIDVSKSKLKVSTVNNHANVTTSSIRISASASINDEDEISKILSRRLEDITDMAASSAEEFQIVNYGVGGYYIYHTDYFKDFEEGNRLATFLIYLSDVELGGSTVFPILGLAIPPRKGTAVFWRNLHPSMLKGDLRTSHASCPVLKGNKWITTKWFWSSHQELRQPCRKRPDTEK